MTTLTLTVDSEGHVDMPGADLSGADLTNADLFGANLAEADPGRLSDGVADLQVRQTRPA